VEGREGGRRVERQLRRRERGREKGRKEGGKGKKGKKRKKGRKKKKYNTTDTHMVKTKILPTRTYTHVFNVHNSIFWYYFNLLSFFIQH
jgi:hypothetical protein